MQHSQGEYIGLRAVQSLDEFISHRKVIYTAIEGRISFIGRLFEDPAVSGVRGALTAATRLVLFTAAFGLLLNCSLDCWR